MAATNVNGRLHLTGIHQKPPASLRNFPSLFVPDASIFFSASFYLYFFFYPSNLPPHSLKNERKGKKPVALFTMEALIYNVNRSYSE